MKKKHLSAQIQTIPARNKNHTLETEKLTTILNKKFELIFVLCYVGQSG